MCTYVFVCLSLLADQSKQRREVVRRKTAEYLKHAEELYQKHLAPASNDEKEKVRVSPSFSPSPPPPLFLSFHHLMILVFPHLLFFYSSTCSFL